MSDLRANRFIEIAIVLAVCAFLFFYGMGSFGLLGADEPRYAQIGGEMLARHDWIVPTLNGTPWLEKPPLLYWGEMAAYAVFGVHDWAARLPVSLMTTAMVLAIFCFVRRRNPAWALDAALITASMVGAIGFGRAASTDMPLTACLTIGILAWIEWYTGASRSWLLLFYAACAFGMLAKGPVAPALAAMVIVAFSAIRREGKWIVGTLWWPAILLFLAISLPWYIAVQLKTGDFFRVFILEHNLARFGTNLYRHHQPFWYYLPVTLALLMPWSSVFIAKIFHDLRRTPVTADRQGNPAPLTLFLWLWLIVPVVFFSLSQSKLPGYVLPSIPAAALLVVEYLQGREDSRLPLALILLHAACCGALFTGVLLAPHFLLRVHPPAAAVATASLAGIVIFAIVVLVVLRRGVRVVHAVTLIPILLSVGFVVKVASPALDATQSARPVAAAIARMVSAHAPIVVYRVPRQTEYGLPYYGFPVTVLDDAGPATTMPAPPYLLVARAGAAQAVVSPAAITQVGVFEPQRLVFYMVSAHRQ